MKTVLIVEDSIELASHWQSAFERHDLHVIHEPEYEKAIQVLHSTSVDLVITDIVLPNDKGQLLDFAGLAILSFIALQLENPPKVIAVSGSIFEQTKLPFLHLLECAQLLQKPFDVKSITTLGLRLLEEKASDERRQKMEEISADYATDSVFWVREDGRLLKTNQQACELLGFSKDEFDEIAFSDLMVSNSPRDWIEFCQRTKDSESVTVSCTLKRNNCEPVHCELQVRFVAIENGEELIFARAHEITDRLANQAALEKTQQQLRLAVAGSNIGIWDWNFSSNELYVSPQWLKQLGLEKDALKTFENWAERIHPDDAQRFGEHIQENLSGKTKDLSIDYKIRHEDGSYRQVLSEGSVTYGNDGNPIRFSGTQSDITDKKLQEELRLLGSAVRASQDAFLIAKIDQANTAKSDVVFINEAYSTMTGYPADETLGRKPRSLEGPETNQDALVVIADAIKHLRPARTEILLYGRDETAFWCDFQLTPIANSRGENTHWLIAMRDITQMKHSSQALREVSTSYRAMVELLGVTDGVWDWKIPTDEVEFQPGYRKVLGYAPDDTVGWPNCMEAIADNLHPDDRERVLLAQSKSLNNRSPFEEQYRLRCKEGTYIWIHDRGAAVYDRDGHPIRMTGSIYDITQQKLTEAALVKEREMLRQSNADLEQFAYVASHDLQEPLRAVGGFMQIIDKKYGEQLDEEGVGYIRKAVAGASRMQQLINDLLYFSRVTREGQPMQTVSLERVAADACVALSKKITERTAEVNIGTLPNITGEPVQLTQLFQNLIDNGIKYCEAEQPRVDITSRETPTHWLVSVVDNGIGIAPEYRKQIFAIFKRLHRREEYPGTGIGLAICQRVVERHGGSISIEDFESGGCEFMIQFPKVLIR